MIARDGLTGPVEGTIDEKVPINYHKLMVHQIGVAVGTDTDTCRSTKSIQDKFNYKSKSFLIHSTLEDLTEILDKSYSS